MWIVPVGVFVMTVLSMAETRYSMFKLSSSRNLLLAVNKSWQGRKGLKQRDRFLRNTLPYGRPDLQVGSALTK